MAEADRSLGRDSANAKCPEGVGTGARRQPGGGIYPVLGKGRWAGGGEVGSERRRLTRGILGSES